MEVPREGPTGGFEGGLHWQALFKLMNLLEINNHRVRGGSGGERPFEMKTVPGQKMCLQCLVERREIEK